MKFKNILGLTTLLWSTTYSGNTSSYHQIPPKSNEESYVLEEPPTCDLERILTIEEQAKQLNKTHNYNITGEDLVFLTRVTYMEAASDSKAKTTEDLKKGWQGVANVIRNRYEFDKHNETHKFSNKLGLRNVIEAPMQFHPVSFFPDLFKHLKNKDDKPRLAYGKINKKRVEQIYQVVVEVLDGSLKDITDSAVYFHTDYVREGRRNGTTAFYLKKNPCKTTYNGQINSHLFFGTTCPIDPYAESI